LVKSKSAGHLKPILFIWFSNFLKFTKNNRDLITFMKSRIIFSGNISKETNLIFNWNIWYLILFYRISIVYEILSILLKLLTRISLVKTIHSFNLEEEQNEMNYSIFYDKKYWRF
jgi:hypothetical protein